MDSAIVAWLKQKRIESGLDLRDLATLAGTSTGQLSRLETESMSLTINFLVVLIWGLKINLDEFSKVCGVPPISLPHITSTDDQAPIEIDQIVSKFENIPYVTTVFEFLRAHKNHTPDAIDLLTRKLTLALEKAKLAKSPFENPKGKIQAAILEGDLLSNPPDLTLEMLTHWYTEGGALTLADAGTYLRLFREQKKYSLQKLGSLSKMTKSTISRLENGQSDRILLDDVMSLDTALDANGKVLSIYWVVAMRQMGIWFSMKDTKRQPMESKEASNLADTFVKVARWSYLYDDPNLPWIEPWIAPVVEVENIQELFNAYLKGETLPQTDLAQQIYDALPSSLFLLEEGEKPEVISPKLARGMEIWSEIEKAVGDDVFGLRVLDLFKKHSQEADYAAGLRMLLRELVKGDDGFAQRIVGLVGDKNKREIGPPMV